MFSSVKTDEGKLGNDGSDVLHLYLRSLNKDVLHLYLRSLNICMLPQASSNQIHAARFSSQ